MSIEAIRAISPDAMEAVSPNAVQAPQVDFMSRIGEGLARVDSSLQAADAQLRGLAAGQDIPLHDVMITMEQARTDLMLVSEVRNRLVEAYQELTRMQL